MKANRQDWLNTISQQDTALDTDDTALYNMLEQMIERHYIGILVDSSLGGCSLSRQAEIDWRVALTCVSYPLAFLVAQYDSALALIGNSSDSALGKARLVKALTASGSAGVAIAHLRNTQSPPMRAIKTPDGYRLDGQVHWVSGYSLFQKCVLGATIDSHQNLYCLLDFKARASLTISSPAPVISTPSIKTVSLTLNQYPITSEQILFVESHELRQARGLQSVTHACFALGLAKRAIIILESVIQEKKDAELRATLETALHKYQHQYQLTYQVLQEKTDNTLQTRVVALKLVFSLLMTLTACHGGRSVLQDDDISRLHRHALQCLAVAGSPSFISAITELN